MGQVFEDFQALQHDGMAFLALDVRDEADAAGVVFVAWVVQTCLAGNVLWFMATSGTARGTSGVPSSDFQFKSAGRGGQRVRVASIKPVNYRRAAWSDSSSAVAGFECAERGRAWLGSVQYQFQHDFAAEIGQHEDGEPAQRPTHGGASAPAAGGAAP